MAVSDSARLALLSSIYGYLSGNDIASWLDVQLVFSRLNIQPRSVQTACTLAVEQVKGKLLNKYDLFTELQKVDTVSPIASAQLTAGGISGVTITAPGSNWIAAPIVTTVRASGDTTGSGAVITAIVTDSVISGLQLLEGGGHYLTPPAIAITGGGGTGATANCTIDKFGHVNSLNLVDPGEGFTGVPAVEFSGGGGRGASATAVVAFGKLTGLTITNPGTLYTAPPILQFNTVNAQAPDTRNPKLVMLCAIYAVRALMGPAQNVSEKSNADFALADGIIEDLRNGMDNLPLYSAASNIRSDIEIVRDTFRQLG